MHLTRLDACAGFQVPGEMEVVGDRIYYRATDPVHGTKLWALE